MSTEILFSAFELANMADVASPDAVDSPGATWLKHVERAARYLMEENQTVDVDALVDEINEAADDIVPIYTHERWQVFVDLAAYTEDVTGFGLVDDMERAAGIALYQIAERLIRAVIEAEGDRIMTDPTEDEVEAVRQRLANE